MVERSGVVGLKQPGLKFSPLLALAGVFQRALSSLLGVSVSGFTKLRPPGCQKKKKSMCGSLDPGSVDRKGAGRVYPIYELT